MDIEKLQKMISQAETHKVTIGWDKQADEALRVKDNDFPVRGKVTLDHIYKDNRIKAAMNHMVSMLSGSEMNISLQSITGVWEKAMQLMDCEVNFIMDYFDWTGPYEKALSDMFWVGIGVMKHEWNPRKITEDFRTGQPQFLYKDARSIYLDPHPDRRFYICEKIEIEDEDLFNYYPEHKKLEKHKGEANIVWVIQHKKTVNKKKICIHNALSDKYKYFDFEEYEGLEGVGSRDQEIFREEELEVFGLGDMSATGHGDMSATLPDGLTMSEPFDMEEDVVTEYVYLANEGKILSSTVIGDDFTYHILQGDKFTDSSYSFGIPYDLIDMQDMSTELMSAMVWNVRKHHKPTNFVDPSGILNYKEIKDSLNSPDLTIEVAPEHLLKTDKFPLQRIDPPKFNAEHEFLERKAHEALKSATGVTDTVRGEQMALSGVAVDRFQMQSRVYHKKHFTARDRFIKSNVAGLMRLIVKYRNYPHVIQGLSDSGGHELTEVAVSNDTMLDSYNYIVNITVDENSEALAMREEDLAIMLWRDNAIIRDDMLRKMPFKDKETLIENINNKEQEMAMMQQQQMMLEHQAEDGHGDMSATGHGDMSATAGV